MKRIKKDMLTWNMSSRFGIIAILGVMNDITRFQYYSRWNNVKGEGKVGGNTSFDTLGQSLLLQGLHILQDIQRKWSGKVSNCTETNNSKSIKSNW